MFSHLYKNFSSVPPISVKNEHMTNEYNSSYLRTYNLPLNCNYIAIYC